MWVWVYDSLNQETKDASIFDEITRARTPFYDGQLLLQDRSTLDIFYTWDRANNRWSKLTGINGVTAADKEATIPIFTRFDFIWESIYRMDYFNCGVWNYCTSDGKWGSHYSLRDSLEIYGGDGGLVETLPSNYRIEFTGGYGFTNSSSLPSSPTGVGIRASGWRTSSGAIHSYGSNVRFASVNFTAHPLNYGVNTA